MKTKTPSELKAIVAEVFKANPDADKVLAFPDGNVFTEDRKNAADLYGKQLGAGSGKGPVKPQVIERERSKPTEPTTDLKHDWDEVTVKEMKAVLDSKEIDHSEAKRKDDYAALLETEEVDPAGAKAIVAEIAEAEAKAKAAADESGE